VPNQHHLVMHVYLFMVNTLLKKYMVQPLKKFFEHFPAAVLTAVMNVNDNMVLMTTGNMIFRRSPYSDASRQCEIQ
jgi:hypothetical protein